MRVPAKTEHVPVDWLALTNVLSVGSCALSTTFWAVAGPSVFDEHVDRGQVADGGAARLDVAKQGKVGGM